MNKYILADMVTERLKREIGMVAKPIPEELKTLEGMLRSERRYYAPALYRAEKLKKILISKRSQGESTAGTVVVIIADDEYDLPWTLADITFDFAGKGKMYVTFQVRPLVKDEESTKKYVAPFRKWREAIDKIPSEPDTRVREPGGFLETDPSPILYRRIHSDNYANEVMNFAEQFFDIFLDIYRKAEPVKDAQRRKEMDAFRSEWNQKILGTAPSGKTLVEIFGQQTAQLFYEYLMYL